MTTWYTSDEHWDHKKIIEYSGRPFRDVEHMQHEMIRRHNSVVRDKDLVYHLGDFCFDERRVAQFRRPLKGRHILIAGNHDKCHPCHKGHEKSKRLYLNAGFEQVYTDVLGMERLDSLPHALSKRRCEGGTIRAVSTRRRWRMATSRARTRTVEDEGQDDQRRRRSVGLLSSPRRDDLGYGAGVSATFATRDRA